MGLKIITVNKKARHDYHILDTYEVGMELLGSEVKSLRNGQCQLKDSYVDIHKGQAYLIGAHISEYKFANINNHEPERKRRLLLNRHEIDRIDSQIREKGLSAIPLRMYFKRGRAKVEIGLAKGKKSFDKRESIKKRDVSRDLRQKIRRDR